MYDMDININLLHYFLLILIFSSTKEKLWLNSQTTYFSFVALELLVIIFHLFGLSILIFAIIVITSLAYMRAVMQPHNRRKYDT